MLRIIEYSLLAVSLLVVIGLVVTGSRSSPDASTSPDAPASSDASASPAAHGAAPRKDNPDTPHPGKTA